MSDTLRSQLKIKLYADGADLKGIAEMVAKPWISGFTTNPTLMRRAGITDYTAFAKEVLKLESKRSVSFEVFADDLPTMEAQARVIGSWGENVYVKIPVTNTKGVSTAPICKTLSEAGIKLNVTALFTLEQVRIITDSLSAATPAIISVFAGRIADSGRDPVPMMQAALAIMAVKPKAELLWASPRELLNVIQADQCGCHIITATNDVLKKLDGLGKDLTEFSRETVQMFRDDAIASGFDIAV